ncbi:MAG: hypothetical protein JJE55_11590 [Flavobacteriaceae bacterium]|nr:hypothetical protein [Flavobacteriaceae bacterium]
MNTLRYKLFIFFTITCLSITFAAQNEHLIFGQWQSQKGCFKKSTASNSGKNLLDKKKLFILKPVKFTDDALVLKDGVLEVTYYLLL